MAGRLADRVRRRERNHGRREQRRSEQADAEQCRRERAGERLKRGRGIARVVDAAPAGVHRCGAGDDDERADHAGHDRAADDIDALVAQLAHAEALVGRI